MSGPKITDEARRKILEAVGIGVHPQVACVAAGMGECYYRDLRRRAQSRGDEVAREFLNAIKAAEAGGEIADVAAASRATAEFEEREINCPNCGGMYEVEYETLAAIVGKFESMQKAKGLAAEVALKKLERRHPQRWSQKVIHTVQEEHDRLLNVAQRVLAPEVFESLLEEYLAAGSGESEASGDQGGEAGGGVH